MEYEKIDTDVLVVGSGAAGCRAAIEAAEYASDVAVVAKGPFGMCGSTNLAGVVYAAAIGHADPRDEPSIHFQDTIVSGRYIGNERIAEILANEAPKTVYDLERFGVRWYKSEDGKFAQLPTPGHRFNRGVYWDEMTGSVVQKALSKEVKRHSNIAILDDIFVTKLLTEDGSVYGAVGLDIKEGSILALSSRSTILATGGSGRIYRTTDMDEGATGDGYALAYRAGGELRDMEMTQFFPTSFVYPESLRGIAVSSSALWSLGLKLYNSKNERFMEKYYPKEKENVPRDLLSRAIFKEIMEGRGTEHGGVWLDTSDIENWDQLRKDRAKSYMWPEKFGLPTSRFEVAPTYHFTIGGIKISETAQTSLRGLYVAGEAAGGLHGANRIGGNALAECVVFGAIAGKNAALESQVQKRRPNMRKNIERECNQIHSVTRREVTDGVRPLVIRRQLADTMTNNVGIIRTAATLRRARLDISQLEKKMGQVVVDDSENRFNIEWVEMLELMNMLQVARIVVRAATARRESRGAHYRSDCPDTNNKDWLRNIVVKQKASRLQLRTIPVKFSKIELPRGMN
jgi:fumarate reductase (CoM/CoB) subunit A